MNIKILIISLAILLILPEVTRAICDAYDQTYRHKSAIFYVTNARKIRVTVYNSMQDVYSRYFSAWIKVDGKYINLDGAPFSPDEWEKGWIFPSPSYRYRLTSGYLTEAEYDLTPYASNGYTGEVEVRVSSDCYEVYQRDPCFCWTAKVEVIEYQPYPPIQYCYLDIHINDNYGNPLKAHIYVDGSYLDYASNAIINVQVGTHVVVANKNGYNSVSKSVSCSCSETKKVEIVLTPVQVCIPGEIRNRYCACSTQIAYERCKADGSGWETVIENCDFGYVCENGYCVLEKDGWYDTGRERCNLFGVECGSGTREKEQEYRDYTCIGATCTYIVKERRWISVGSCYQGCDPGYTCQAGYCMKISTPPTCEARYLNEFKCFGNWVQRKYIYSDCSISWRNWEYCSYGCSDGTCLPRLEEPCKISINVETPSDASVGELIATTLKLRNYGDVDGYVSFDAYVCNTDAYCIPMDCEVDPTVYLPAHSTRSLTCTARVQEAGRYEVKVSYGGCEKSGTIYSGVFSIKEKKTRCFADYLDEFKCSGNWRLQLYKYSDCSTGWVYVEYCSNGCENGYCLPKPTTTTLPVQEKFEEAAPSTGLIVWSNELTIASLLLALFIAILVTSWLWKDGKFRRRQKPEWFRKCF
ncbi:MAG: PEGA domain-containing protein [Candidatus Aenigmatarchaeota archaeon]